MHLKPGQRRSLSSPPGSFSTSSEGLFHGAMVNEVEPAAMVLAFIKDRAHLERAAPQLKRPMDMGAALWVAFSKTSSGIPTANNGNKIWGWAQTNGMDAVANCSIDDIWPVGRLKVQ